MGRHGVVPLAEHGGGNLEYLVHDRLGGSDAAVDGGADVQHGNATDHDGITWGQFAGLGDNRPAGITAGSARSVRSVSSRSEDGWAAGMAAPVRVHSGGGRGSGEGAPCAYPGSPSHSSPAQPGCSVNYSYVVVRPFRRHGSTVADAPSTRKVLTDVRPRPSMPRGTRGTRRVPTRLPRGADRTHRTCPRPSSGEIVFTRDLPGLMNGRGPGRRDDDRGGSQRVARTMVPRTQNAMTV